MRNIFLLMICCSLVFSCNGVCEEVGRISDRVTAVTNKTGTEIQKKYRYLNFCGIGGAINHNDGSVKFEKLDFQVRKKINQDQALSLLLRIVDTYITNIYKEESLKEYLENHPFTYKNLEITLFIYDEKMHDVCHPDLSDISLHEGNVVYETLGRDEHGTLVTVSRKTEPYEEALARMKHSLHCKDTTKN